MTTTSGTWRASWTSWIARALAGAAIQAASSGPRRSTAARSCRIGPTPTGPAAAPARARGTPLEALERLAAALAQAGRLPEAIRRYRAAGGARARARGLAPGAHALLRDAGERAQALRQFHACRTSSARAGRRAGPETTALYRGSSPPAMPCNADGTTGWRVMTPGTEPSCPSTCLTPCLPVSPHYPPPPYRYRDCPADGRSLRRRARRHPALVPHPLEPHPDDLAYVAIGHLHNDRLGSTREAFVVVPSTDGERSGNYSFPLPRERRLRHLWPRDLGLAEEAGRGLLPRGRRRGRAVVRRRGADLVRASLRDSRTPRPPSSTSRRSGSTSS